MDKQHRFSPRQSNRLSWRAFLVALWQSKITIMVWMMFSLLLSSFYFRALPVKYHAASTIMLSEHVYPSVSDDQHSDNLPYSPVALDISSETELLRSKRLASMVIEQLELFNHPEFLRRAVAPWTYWWQLLTQGQSRSFVATGRLSRAQLLKSFSQRLTVTSLAHSRVVEIKFWAWEQNLAAQLPVALAEAYRSYHQQLSRTSAENSRAWLQQELQQVNTRLQYSQSQWQAVGGEPALSAQELAVEQHYQRLQQSRSQHGDALRQMKALAQLRLLLEDIKPNQANDVAGTKQLQLNAQLAQVTGFAQSLTELSGLDGPDFLDWQTAPKLASSQQISTLLAQLDDYAMAVQQTAASMAGRLEEAEYQYERSIEALAATRLLRSDIEKLSRLYEDCFQQLQQVKALAAQQNSPLLIDRAALVAQPLPAARWPMKLAVALVSFALLILWLFLKQVGSQRFARLEDLEAMLDLEVISEVPSLKQHSEQWSIQGVHPWFAEPIRLLRVRLQMQGNDGQLVLFCSALAGEGKTSIAIQTAAACCEVERVLLINANFHTASVSGSLGACTSQIGLSHLLARTHSVAQCIQRDQQLGFDILACGLPQADSRSLLASQKFALLLKGLRQHYDRILIETSPLQQANDSLVVAPLVDAIILVVEAERSDSHVLKKALHQFLRLKLEVTGVLLNKVAQHDCNEEHRAI